MSMAENIDTAIKDIENNFSGGLSNTSTKKFDALVAIVSTITGLPADEIYPTSVVARASNVWNRLSQGKPLNKHFSLAIAIGAKGAESGMMAPLASFIGDGNVHYDTIAILSPDSTGVWRFSHVVTNAKDECALKIKAAFSDVKLHLLNAYKPAKKNVVRACLFSDLEYRFEEWLPKNGVVSAAGKYVRNLKAISEPQQPHSGTGKWDGLFHDLIGEEPGCKIFEVAGLDNFKAVYGVIIPFFNSEFEDKENLAPQYSSANYSRIFDFVHAAPSKTEIAEKDSQFTRSGFRKYQQFLEDLEAMVNASCEASGQLAYQLITYGAPGTGKSHKVDGLANNPDVAACVRTTFHPDSDYSTFVGAYKPVMNGEKIAYEFRPQAFMKAYVRAWQEMVNSEDGKVKDVVLVIEEINRGNCAQIFGDLFQLLDRGNGGYSTYPIEADTDLATWLAKDDQLGNKLAALSKPEDIKRLDDWSDILSGKKLALPPNLYILATMNTSDQSLFPIDSAFKRRWDWEYVPITKPDKSDDSNWKERKIEVGDSLFDWWEFLVAINGHIAKVTESEDKQLGYFFVKADDVTGYISAEQFANKVLFYLYGDVFKSYELPGDDCFKVNGEMLRFRDFFSDEAIKENEKKSRVKVDRLEAFLSGLKWDGKGVTKTNKSTVAPSAPKEESSGDGSAEAMTEA